MERLEISVACRNYYGEDLAQLRTSQGDFPEIVSGDSCWRAVLYRWNYQGSKGSFGQTETPEIWLNRWETTITPQPGTV